MISFNACNYRGYLKIKEVDKKYYWTVECDYDVEDAWFWEEIPRELYIALISYGPREDDHFNTEGG